MLHMDSFTVSTRGRGICEITDEVQEIVRRSGVRQALCTVFIHHTSASLIVSENADPDVRTDLETFLGRLVPDGDPSFVHTCEGPDDMASHVRSILTQTSIGIPVREGSCDLGTWQGIFLWEHRMRPHRRRVTVVVLGEPTSSSPSRR
jgi:secondary thiamine-phosphate synthase enzyme